MPQCPCKKCSRQIEFPEEMAGQEIACPICGQPTTLALPGIPQIKIPRQPPRGPVSRSAGSGQRKF